METEAFHFHSHQQRVLRKPPLDALPARPLSPRRPDPPATRSTRREHNSRNNGATTSRVYVRRILVPNDEHRNESVVFRFVHRVGQRSRAIGVDARAASPGESGPPRPRASPASPMAIKCVGNLPARAHVFCNLAMGPITITAKQCSNGKYVNA